MISKLQNKTDYIFSIATLLLPLVVGMLFIKAGIGSPHDASRIATIQSIVEQHSLCIDKSILPLAVDIIKIDGKTYSDKPPMLAILGSGIYFIFYHILHLNLTEHFKLIYYWLTFFLSVVPLGITCFLLNKLFEQQGITFNLRLVLFLSAWLGTLMLPFSGTLTNHLAAAGTATLSLYLLIQSYVQVQHSHWRTFWLGFFSAMTFTLDLPAGGLVLISFSLIYFWRNHRVQDYLYFGLGIGIPLLTHFTVNYALTGDLVPAYLHTEYYQYPGSVLVSEIGKKRLFGKTIAGQYWHMLFGYRGILLFSPILLFGIADCLKVFIKKYWINDTFFNYLRLSSLTIFFGTLTAYAIQISDFGGTSYGLRWIITSIPLLLYFVGLNANEIIRRVKKIIGVLCLVWSILISFIGVYNPWSLNIISPIPFIDNLAYLTLDYFPQHARFVEIILDKTSLEKGLAYYELGKYFLNRNLPEKAIPYYEQSIKYAPHHTLTYYHLGIALDQVGKPSEAIPIYEKLLLAEPDNIGALNNFGISLIKAGEFTRAETIYRRSISLDSTRAIAHFGLAVSLFEQNKFTEAAKEAAITLQIQPDFLPAKKLLSDIQNLVHQSD
ncbi:MAG: tetratricopeptide repeat protein [bacterium]|nr:tetratricopeptide repeat protein [bacterium]